jgi:hypothetical protein
LGRLSAEDLAGLEVPRKDPKDIAEEIWLALGGGFSRSGMCRPREQINDP